MTKWRRTTKRAWPIALALTLALGSGLFGPPGLALETERPWEELIVMEDKIVHSDEEWKALLTAEAYAILRLRGTERPFSSELLNNEAKGLYRCAGCGNALFRSEAKFDSKSGWPSFRRSQEGAVTTESDKSHLMVRTEVLCARCDGHLGHVFDDGPPPEGKRDCITGAALVFEEDQ